jgi:hypothetical protein
MSAAHVSDKWLPSVPPHAAPDSAKHVHGALPRRWAGFSVCAGADRRCKAPTALTALGRVRGLRPTHILTSADWHQSLALLRERPDLPLTVRGSAEMRAFG